MNKIFSSMKCNTTDPTVKKFVEAGLSLTERYTSKRVNEPNYKSKATARVLNFSAPNADQYKEDNKTFMESLMKHCVDNSLGHYAWNGIDTIKNSMVNQDVGFRSTFNAVISQIMTPVAPAVVSATYMEIAEIQQVGYGETGRFIVNPNDTFLVQDIAEGVQFGGLQRLYKNEVVVNPQPKQIRYDMDWYQVASGIFDFGEWAYKVGISFAGYINAVVIQAFTAVINDLFVASSPYVAAGWSDLQYITIGQTVKAANANKDILVFGTLIALGSVIPNQVGLQYGLGEEWSKVGYLDSYKGFKLMEIDQALVPGTVNTTANLIVPNDVLYFIAVDGYRPIKVVFEGANVTVETVPTETPDKTGGLAITMRMGTTVAVGSKFGALTI
jgi:hypothetical protein